MSRVLPLVVVVLALATTVYAGAAEQPATSSDEVFEKEVQAAGQAWQFSGVELPKGYVATITATGSWEINPNWEKKVGPGGNGEHQAGETYVKSGANEGCLLIRVGDTVLAFSKDNEVIRISTPGKIYCCANDEPTAEGLARAKDYIGAIPIPAKDVSGTGYQDNSGMIKVRIAVKKAEK